MLYSERTYFMDYYTRGTDNVVSGSNNIQILFKDAYIYLILFIVLIVTYLHYSTDVEGHLLHDIYRRLYYIPIILAAFRYSLFGGVGIAILVSLVYSPYVFTHWFKDPNLSYDKLLEIILYNVVGIISGLLVRQEHAQHRRYKEIATELEKSIGEITVQSEKVAGLESQLRLADRLAVMGELTASFAHEVRNPLSAIKGIADMLNKKLKRDKSNDEILKILENSIQSINGVVDSYLSYAQPEIDDSRSCNLIETLNSAIDLMTHEIKKRDVDINFILPAQEIEVEISEIDLRQITLNLLLNSLDAIKNTGKIKISIEQSDNRVIIQFSDTGNGISADKLDEIFKPFITTKPTGTGLGLPIVKRIVENVRGEISIESEEGKGATFRISIPLVKNA